MFNVAFIVAYFAVVVGLCVLASKQKSFLSMWVVCTLVVAFLAGLSFYGHGWPHPLLLTITCSLSFGAFMAWRIQRSQAREKAAADRKASHQP